MNFQFELGDLAVIAESGEQGKVIGRAEYIDCPPSFLIRYQQSNGVAVEMWWIDGALRAPEKPRLA
jgi:hypothetical protein